MDVWVYLMCTDGQHSGMEEYMQFAFRPVMGDEVIFYNGMECTNFKTRVLNVTFNNAVGRVEVKTTAWINTI